MNDMTFWHGALLYSYARKKDPSPRDFKNGNLAVLSWKNVKRGFDREKYIRMQSAHIAERRDSIGGKLYLEMGGKLFDDYHASRVLPGFTPDNKIAMLETLKDELEILVCMNAKDLQRQKVRADLGITYEDDVLRLIDIFRDRGFLVQTVVITQFEDDNTLAFDCLLYTSPSPRDRG